jgi:hypothetical protein
MPLKGTKKLNRLTGTERQRRHQEKLITECQTPDELFAHFEEVKRKNREAKKRQRQRRKAEALLEQQNGPKQQKQTAATLVAKRAIPIIKWTKATTKRKDVLPEYNTGKLNPCPDELQGDSAMAAIVLEGISDYLKKKWFSVEMDALRYLAAATTPPNITGIRMISGNRFEFYVRVKNCTPAAFYELLRCSERMRRKESGLVLTDEELVELVRMIVEFAIEQARPMVGVNSSFQNFAYIVSYGKVAGQDVHIDLGKPGHCQMGMLCSPKGELTSEYKCDDTCNVVQEGDKLSTIWEDLPPGIQAVIDGYPFIQKLLDGFGPLLSGRIEKMETSNMVPFGTMLCLPGRVMHCAPEVTQKTQLRAVMFFTATPNEDQENAYSSETQYCRTTIIQDILVYTWPYIGTREKQYMLTKWTEVGLSVDSEDAVKVNMSHKDLKVIALALREALRSQTKEVVHQLIKNIAQDGFWNRKNNIARWENDMAEPYEIPPRRKINRSEAV